jgi:hypothetical protein
MSRLLTTPIFCFDSFIGREKWFDYLQSGFLTRKHSNLLEKFQFREYPITAVV